MASNTLIEWTATPREDGTLAPGHTGNLWWGCTAVHAGCDNCYAETLAKRHGHKIWGNKTPRKATKSVWKDFLKWQAFAADAGEMHRVFVGSMMDIFEKPMPLVNWQGEPIVDRVEGWPVFTDSLRERFFNEIVPACPNLDFLLLTKRPSNINKYIPSEWKLKPPPNVMFGTSPVNQKTFIDLVNQLKQVNGRLFLSIEPQLEVIVPTRELLADIDWVIQGGESGQNKRPFYTAWARIMRDICQENNIPYFFKQIDKVQPIPPDLMVRQFPTQPIMA